MSGSTRSSTTSPRCRTAHEKTRGLWEHVEHLIGKDILKPHGVYWPTMLKAAGIPLYHRLNVHGYWSLGGGKMSKSVGNVVEAFSLTDKYGHDAFRYFLLREMNFGLDASFSEEALVDRLNADLANDLGNLASRATHPDRRRRPRRAGDRAGRGGGPAVRDRRRGARGRRVSQAMEEFAFQRALAASGSFIGAVNRYVDAMAPWALAKDPDKRERLERCSTRSASRSAVSASCSIPSCPTPPRRSAGRRRDGALALPMSAWWTPGPRSRA